MSQTESHAGNVLSLCCGGKKCPVFTLKSGGVRITDAEILKENSIELTEKQATALRAWLEQCGF
jgi:hypothetical protein